MQTEQLLPLEPGKLKQTRKMHEAMCLYMNIYGIFFLN